MARIRWTGWGILSVLMAAACAVVTFSLITDQPAGELAPALVKGGIVFLIGGLLNHGLAVALNSTSGPSGRVWHNRHTAEGFPMQVQYRTFVGGAVVTFAAAIGAATSWLVFWFLIAVAALAAWGLPAVLRALTYRTAHQQRQGLAASGWRCWESDGVITGRWTGRWLERRYRGRAFGVVAGERNGVPVTIFDGYRYRPSRLATDRRTTWAVHLPAVYPTTVVRVEDGTIAVDTENQAFARGLVTAGVVAALVNAGFGEWRIEGRDLLYAMPNPGGALTAAQLVEVAEDLTAAVAGFPPEYGTPTLSPVPSPGQLAGRLASGVASAGYFLAFMGGFATVVLAFVSGTASEPFWRIPVVVGAGTAVVLIAAFACSQLAKAQRAAAC